MYSRVTPEMTLRFVGDLEVFRIHPKLLQAKLYGPGVNGPRFTYALGLFLLPLRGYKFSLDHVENRQPSLLQFVCGKTS